MARYSQLAKHNKTWWTRERVLLGLKRCYEDFHQLPTCQDSYHALTQFTGELRNGRPSTLGWHRRYPSYGPISNYFGGMREAWNAVNEVWPELKIVVDRGHEDWTAEEDWFIKESVGVIPRDEVARLMRRTGPAIKRRLYDLGEGNCYSLWGWTINHIARVLKVSHSQILKYIKSGQLPFFQGNKCIYIDPGDLLLIREYNWSKKRHPKELEDAVRAALMKRLCFVLLGHDWRKYRYHKVQPLKSFRTGAVRPGVPSQTPAPEPPAKIKVGMWVTVVTKPHEVYMVGRTGKVLNIKWRSERVPAKGKATPACWMALIQFRKCREWGRPQTETIRYSVRLDCLVRARKPRNLLPPRLVPGTWVRVTKAIPHRSALGRVGQIRSVQWHAPFYPQDGGAPPPPCWIAQVEFPKAKLTRSSKVKSVTYSAPVDSLKKVPKPEVRIPGDLKVGCWARITRDLVWQGTKGRIGKVLSLQFRAKNRRDARRGKSTWVAMLEVTKHRRYWRSSKKTISFCVPAAYLEKVRKPYTRRSARGKTVARLISRLPAIPSRKAA